MPTPAPHAKINVYRRLKTWDYARGASLFITISTKPRRPIFGKVAGGKVLLSPIGRIAAESLAAMPRFNPGISVFEHVVMPDHLHFNVHVAAGLAQPLMTLGNAIRRFKNHVNRAFFAQAGLGRPSASEDARAAPLRPCASEDARAGLLRPSASEDARAALAQSIWQQGYHDRLCLCRRFIDATARYINYNPLKWELMHNMPGALAVHEPLDSPRLDPGEYWKGVGNVALLDPQLKLVSLRVSRKLATPAAIAPVVARMENAVAKGYVIISGFISPGERAVRDMLCANEAARFIRILPSRISNEKPYKPESRYVAPFAEGRYLEIARGNEDVEFGRLACLDLNAEIVKMAHAGEGLAVYWQPQGPVTIARA